MKNFLFLALLLGLWACKSEQSGADQILFNGSIATANPEQPEAEALAISGDRIVAVGSWDEVAKFQGPNTQMLDLEGKFLMPGFIEGHGHFSGLGMSLLNLNFLKAESWDEIVAAVAEAAATLPPGTWIEGRGWHQEKWTQTPDQNQLGYPFHQRLSELTPEHPVVLFHASGHALFANALAMEAAGISAETPNPEGGAILRDLDGEAIGVFEERAMRPVREAYGQYLETLPDSLRLLRWEKAIELAQDECLAKGITSFQDAGSSLEEIERYRDWARNDRLRLRLWVMIRHNSETLEGKLDGFPVVNEGQHKFTCRAMKSEVDGALGAFGAWLLRPYHDKPGFEGQNTTPISEVRKLAAMAHEHGLQFCVHAIGDRANRVVLDLFSEKLEPGNDLRWRVEHAQHLSPADIPRFQELSVIASMQGIHCTSDAPFVERRLGTERSKVGAYAWRSLIDAGVLIANGTDAPVEDVDPLLSFYASVTRRRSDTGMDFFPEQSMTREEALYSYTRWNAFASFEDGDKGSLEPGKLADMVLLSENLLTCPDEAILQTQVLRTMVGGNWLFNGE